MTRRTLLNRLALLINGIAAVLVGAPLIGFIFAPAVEKAKNKWVSLGKLETFTVGQTKLAEYMNPYLVPWDGQVAKVPCWVRRIDEKTFQVFAINCAHLGCPVKWFAESKLFMCPCHGGVYYEDGSRASGPPPRGLFEYEYRVENGNLEVRGGRLPTIQESV
jgi:Rieske Fe-S protein